MRTSIKIISGMLMLYIYAIAFPTMAQSINHVGRQLQDNMLPVGDSFTHDESYVMLEQESSEISRFLLQNQEDLQPEEIEIELGHYLEGDDQIYLFDSLYHPGELYNRGYHEARLYYRRKGTFWGAFGVGFLTPYTYFVPGIVVGGIMAAVPPNELSLRFYDKRMLVSHFDTYHSETNDLFNDINYSRGYRKGAHHRKAGSVAGGMGVGVLTGVGVAVIILVSFLNAVQ